MADDSLAHELKDFERALASTLRWIEQQQGADKLDKAGAELLAKLQAYIRQCQRKIRKGQYNRQSLAHWRVKITETWFGIVKKEMRG